jgi:hypothetical protein
MLLLFVFSDNFVAHTALCGTTVTLNCMSHSLRARNQIMAVRTDKVFDLGLVGFAVHNLLFSAKYSFVLSCESTLLFNFFWVDFYEFGCCVVATDTSTLTFSL